MRLYQENAKDLIGKKIGRHKRMFGYYPMTILKTNGGLYVIDTNGVCMPIPEKEKDPNCFNFDFVID